MKIALKGGKLVGKVVCSSMPRSASGEEKDEKTEKTKTAKIAERLAKVSLQ